MNIVFYRAKTNNGFGPENSENLTDQAGLALQPLGPGPGSGPDNRTVQGTISYTGSVADVQIKQTKKGE